MRKKGRFYQTRFTWYQGLRLLFQLLYLTATVFAIVGKDFIVAIALMAIALIGGAWFCGWLCPFGMVQEWLGRLGNRLFRFKLTIPQKAEKYLRLLRYLLLAAGTAGLMALGFLSAPYNTFISSISGVAASITVTAWVLLGLFLAASLVIDRPFCRYFCTEGARYGVLSLGRLFTIRRNEESCVSCGICDRACPTQVAISTKGQVRNAQCINCMECIASCPKPGTLTYGFAFTRKKKRQGEDTDEKDE